MSAQQPPRVTPKIRELVAIDRQSRPPVGRLTAQQVDALIAVARRQVADDVPLSVRRAVAALAEGAPADRALPVIEGILAEASAPQPDRVTAARSLASIATPDAERLILQQLDDAEPAVRQELLAALGTFASRAAAEPLAQRPAEPDPAVRRQLALTQALIAHRHGLDGPFLPPAPAAKPPRGTAKGRVKVEFSTRAAKAVAADRKKLTGSTFGIGLADRALRMKCGPTDWTIFLNESLGPTAKNLAPLFKRPLIAGVLAQRYPEGEGLASRMVMLTRPAGDEVRIDIARPDGEVLYVGAARRSADAVGFTISDVDRAGDAPVHLEGEVQARGVQLSRSVALTTRRDVRRTEEVAIRP